MLIRDNYKTIYLHSDNIRAVNEEDAEFMHRVCFSSFFSGYQTNYDAKIKTNIVVRICKDDTLAKNGFNHYCLFTLEEINWYLEYLQQYFKFNFTIRIVDEYYNIYLGVNDYHYFNKTLLTYIRYLYEHPYTRALREVFEWNRLNIYPKLNLENKFMVISKSFNGWGTGHSHLYPNKVNNLHTLKQLKDNRERIIQNELYNVNDYNKHISGMMDFTKINLPEWYVDLNENNDFDYSTKAVMLRLKTHKKNLKIIKDYIKNNG